jgi:hypothetical protein
MKVMILKSVGGQEFVRVVGVPRGMDMLQAREIAAKAIDKATAENPDNINKALKEAGFILPARTIHGPVWDSFVNS